MPPKGFRSVSLPLALLLKIDNLVDLLRTEKIGPSFRGRAHFIDYAVNKTINDIIQIYALSEREGLLESDH